MNIARSSLLLFLVLTSIQAEAKDQSVTNKKFLEELQQYSNWCEYLSAATSSAYIGHISVMEKELVRENVEKHFGVALNDSSITPTTGSSSLFIEFP